MNHSERCPHCGRPLSPSPRDLKRWRERLGLTQRKLGAKLGISAAYVAYLEMGRRTAGPRLASRLFREMKKESPGLN